jgi:hypothetical protein
MEEQEEQEDKNDKTYKSCCFIIDSRFTRFVCQISIYYIILSLAIYKLVTIVDKSEDKSIWISLVTMILGIVTESTKLKRKTDLTLDEPRPSQSQ